MVVEVGVGDVVVDAVLAKAPRYLDPAVTVMLVLDLDAASSTLTHLQKQLIQDHRIFVNLWFLTSKKLATS